MTDSNVNSVVYFPLSSESVILSDENMKVFLDEDDIIGLRLSIDRWALEDILGLRKKLVEAINEDTPSIVADVHRLVQFEGFVNSEDEILPHNRLPNVYEIELRVNIFEDGDTIVLTVALSGDPRDTIDIGIDFDMFVERTFPLYHRFNC